MHPLVAPKTPKARSVRRARSVAARCDRTTARTANTQQTSEQMEPRRDTLVRSRLTEPVHYSSRCFVADCPIGSLAVDALCMWSEYEKDGDGLEVCLLPTRSLQTGIYAGVVDSEAVAAAMPDDNVVTLFLTVAQLERTLAAAQSAAWEQCLRFEESVSWQVAGAQLTRRCGPPAEPSRPATTLRLQRRDGDLVAAGSGGVRVPIVTLRSALAVLPTPAEPPIEQHISMRHVLADYLQAHSPLNYSREARHAYTRIQHDASCGSSACGPAAALDTPILRAYNGPTVISTTLWTLATIALLTVAALALTLWRRRRARQALASAPGSSRRSAVEAPPEFMAQARVVDERAPLRSGSTRLTSSRQLGQ